MSSTVLGFVAFLLIASAGVQWFRAARQLRLPKNRSGFVAVWLVGIALGAVALFAGAPWPAGIAAGLSVLGGAFFLLTVAISRQEVSPDAVHVGATLPGFTATEDTGETFDSVSLAGHPVLIKFFRGHW